MNKDIKYSGLTAVPSDYECPDGSLSTSLNLLIEGGGSIHAVRPPKTIRSFEPGFDPVFLHKTAIASDNLIVLRPVSSSSSTSIFFCDFADDSSPLQPVETITGQVLNCAAVGNTLVIVTSQGLRYYLFSDGTYTPLGSRPPFVSLSFSMVKSGELSKTADSAPIPAGETNLWQYFAGLLDNSHTVDLNPDSTETEAFMQRLSTPVFGLLLSEVADKVTSKGMFYQPMFVRYAFRLFDGSYAWHSAPVLMLPTVCVPRIEYVKCDLDAGSSCYTFTSTLHVAYFALAKKILSDRLSDLARWKDIISSLDIFISAPIYTYSQSESISGWARLSDIYARTALPYGHRPSQRPGRAFVGHYADSIDSDPSDKIVTVSDYDNYKAWNLTLNDKFDDQIADTSLFYLFKSIPFDDIKADSAPSLIEPDSKDLSNLVTRPTLPDDYQSHFRIIPSFATFYNSRLHLCGVSLGLPDPMPVASAVEAAGPASSRQEVSIRIWSKRNGSRLTVLSQSHGDADLYPLSIGIPRYFYYPDPSAYLMQIRSASTSITLPLLPHPTLNGAYFYAGLDVDPASKQTAAPDSTDLPDTAPALSKVYVSEATNPFSFPAAGIVTVGSGHVFALASATKALSQGQFGQFPLYAFSSEGVWALEVSTSGAYSARQPVTRDFCVNPRSITQIDSAVLFASDRGIMMLSGSQAQCISDAIDSDTPFDPLALPGIDSLRELLGLSDYSAVSPVAFRDFISDCSMVYDYTHQRIILFSPSRTYAYVYSMTSKMWGSMRSNILHSLNSYPESLAVANSGSLVSFSIDSDTALPGLIVSRPIKLGSPDILKTLDTMIQRGHFRKGNVKCVLYGSRDLLSWHLVRSSHDHFLRGFRGTPYKYFRMVLLCNLDLDESISGCSVNFTPRLTNRLR